MLATVFSIVSLFSNGSHEQIAKGKEHDCVKEITMWYQENKVMIPGFDKRVADFNEQ